MHQIRVMSGKLHLVQAKMRKSRETSHSFFHDPDFEHANFLLFTEPYAALGEKNTPFSVPTYHTKWQAFYPSEIIQPTSNRAMRAPFRSMIWGAKGQKIQQVSIHSSDITAVILFFPERSIFLVSVDIPCSTGSAEDEPRLLARLDLIRQAYLKCKTTYPELELVVSGDLNRWDTLWGGDQLASHPRQGEGRSIIEFLSEFDLQLLLSRGTITYLGNSRGGTSTIDLIMTTSRLFSDRIICRTHKTAHGSDHLTISTEFFMDSQIL